MQLTKLLIVFVTLFERICLSSIIIKTDTTAERAKFREAAINVLMNCYIKQNKTILLGGDYPEGFIGRLMSQQSFSLVMLDDRRRAEDNVHHSAKINQMRKHKVDVVVIMAPWSQRAYETLASFVFSVYDNPLASTLLLGWSSTNRGGGCDSQADIYRAFYIFFASHMFNANLMCPDREGGIQIYGYDPFTNQPPAPWRLVECVERSGLPCFGIFIREYRDDKEMCENLEFDKMYDLKGWPIRTTHAFIHLPAPTVRPDPRGFRDRRLRIQAHKRTDFINNFITHVNGSVQFIWRYRAEGEYYTYLPDTMDDVPFVMGGLKSYPTFTYPHETSCVYLVSQFRGNMTQLGKLYAVIDGYSWIGMYSVYLVTLIFFTFFLQQPLITGLTNLCRLTCNWGLPKLPTNVAPRIYVACLLFFVVIMQGIYAGKLASLLTHEFPVRQVNSLQDLIDLDYTVFAVENHWIHFSDEGFKRRLRRLRLYENCVSRVMSNSMIACATEGAQYKSHALKVGAHVSTDCIAIEYLHSRVPWRWNLIDKLNMFLLNNIATGIVMPLCAIVEEKRMLEEESQEVVLNPEVMTMKHLGFAFVILAIGLACATVTFIVEKIIYRSQRRVKKTRVIVLRNCT